MNATATLPHTSARASSVPLPVPHPLVQNTFPSETDTGPTPSTLTFHREHTSPAAAERTSTPIISTLSLVDPFLDLSAAMLDDLEKARSAAAARLRTLTTPADQLDADGVARGFGLSLEHRDVARLASMVDALSVAEHEAALTLTRTVRRHPMWPWAKELRGVGEKQFARLLAAIGDPYINGATGAPRTVGALRAYCGLHVLPAPGRDTSDAQVQVAGGGFAPRRKKGVQANWSTQAKTRTWLIVESCQKQVDRACKAPDGGYVHAADGCGCSPYKVVVDRRRERTAVTHPEWTGAHSLADGMRVASKELLKHAWREARRLHLEAG